MSTQPQNLMVFQYPHTKILSKNPGLTALEWNMAISMDVL